ncbi:MAG: hypothetical protein CVU56_13335 [Deltaproteobacteria bacterium HGW-Deltaproteobacteria-14]|nr:MAG: hypothetical protein CVU56_13335 [Deltaproteobacteria bacterium HGW-Deltaproteobacteria-14]
MTTTTADIAPSASRQPFSVGTIGRLLASGRIFFWSASWLLVLLVAGTVAQASIGLYQAQQEYFSSWLTWAGPIPLPGGRLTMGLIVINLFAALIWRSHWRWNRAGVIIAHVGALLLFIGGFVTAISASEGSLSIPEGGASATVRDYNELELAVVDTTNPGVDEVIAFGGGLLKAGAVLTDPALPFQLEVDTYHRNATAARRMAPATGDEQAFNSSWELKGLSLDPEHERNRAGLTVHLAGAGGQDGTYLLLQDMNVPQNVTVNGHRYGIALRGRQYELPFTLQLIDFEKKVHPGTGMPKAFKSTVNLIDGDVNRRVIIQMNEPLRYKGYTLFQSSYIQGRGPETTVLAVVQNDGRLFPYISSIVICIGLLLHLLLQVPKLIGRSRV